MSSMIPQFDQLRFRLKLLTFASLMSSSPLPGLMPNPTSKLPDRLFDVMCMLHESTVAPRNRNSSGMYASMLVEMLTRRLLPTTDVDRPLLLIDVVSVHPFDAPHAPPVDWQYRAEIRSKPRMLTPALPPGIAQNPPDSDWFRRPGKIAV